MSSKYNARIKRGIELLDQHKRGWRDKINLRTLDLGSCEHCVLGLVFEDDIPPSPAGSYENAGNGYTVGKKIMGIPKYAFDADEPSAAYYGFDTAVAGDTHAGLQVAWKRHLIGRMEDRV